MDWIRQYEENRPIQSAFTVSLKRLITEILETAEVDVVLVEARTKSVPSFAEKISRKQGKYASPLAEITDLSGIRVITYYREDVDFVARLLSTEFDLAPVERDGARELDRFGYESMHFIARLGESRAHLTEWRAFAGLCAEIQVRTALQHAWSSVSHKIAYKKEDIVPAGLRRRLSILSALFELADVQFSELRKASAELVDSVVRGDLDIALDTLSLTAFLEVSESYRRLSEAAAGAGWILSSKNAENSAMYDQDRADLLNVLVQLGVSRLDALEEVLSSPETTRAVELLGELRGRDGVDRKATLDDILTQAVIACRATDVKDYDEIYASRPIRIISEAAKALRG